VQRAVSPSKVGVTKLFLEADRTDTSAKLTLAIDTYDDYAQQLKDYRKRNKVKQKELAGLLGVNDYALRSWEQKKAKPPYHVWRRFKEFVKGNELIE
jgi:DNA-binding transcriptional regulator YiaG